MEKKVNYNTSIYVAGHKGMVGSAVLRLLRCRGYRNLLYRSSSELDLCEQQAVRKFFAAERPQVVILAAAKVGGIAANNNHPAEFIYQNLQIATNVIDSCYRNGVSRLINLGSSCIYPKLASQPLREDSLLSGPLEPTNEAYAIAKIAAIKLCQFYNRQYNCDFISVMPPNLYGQGDNFDLETSHFLPAMVRRFSEAVASGATEVELWGDGSPFREVLHADDLARALLLLIEQGSRWGDLINIGSGSDLRIAEYARLVAQQVGYHGKISWNVAKPAGTPRKLLDSSKFKSSGWQAEIDLNSGIKLLHQEYLQQKGN